MGSIISANRQALREHVIYLTMVVLMIVQKKVVTLIDCIIRMRFVAEVTDGGNARGTIWQVFDNHHWNRYTVAVARGNHCTFFCPFWFITGKM